jgi:hypothetical protein
VAPAREWPKVSVGVAPVRDDKAPQDLWWRLPNGLAPWSGGERWLFICRRRQGLCARWRVSGVRRGLGLGRVRSLGLRHVTLGLRRVTLRLGRVSLGLGRVSLGLGRRCRPRDPLLGLLGTRSVLRRRNRRRIRWGERRRISVIRKLHLIERDGVSERAVARTPNDLVTKLAARGRLRGRSRCRISRRRGWCVRSRNVRRFRMRMMRSVGCLRGIALRCLRGIALRRGGRRVSRRSSGCRAGRDRSAATVAEAVARLEHHAAFGAGAHRGREHIRYPRRAGHSPYTPLSGRGSALRSGGCAPRGGAPGGPGLESRERRPFGGRARLSERGTIPL